MKLFLQSTRKPEVRFEVLSFDPVTKKGRLRSLSYGTVFEENLDKDYLVKVGYRVEKVMEEDHA
jgi:hypothetical protein